MSRNYAWCKRFGQFEAVDVKRLRALEAENTRLKKVLAERVMDIEILKDVAEKNGERVRALQGCPHSPAISAAVGLPPIQFSASH